MEYIRERRASWEGDDKTVVSEVKVNGETVDSFTQTVFTDQNGTQVSVRFPPQTRDEIIRIERDEPDYEVWEVYRLDTFEEILDEESYTLNLQNLSDNYRKEF
jgi:hypothetical protein